MGESAASVSIALDTERLERLWLSDGLDLTAAQAALLPKLHQWLARRKGDVLAEFLTGQAVERERLEPTLAKGLTADILARFTPRARGLDALAVLTRIIDRCNGFGIVTLCPPPIAILTRRQPSPFAAERWPMITLAPLLRAHLAESVRSTRTIEKEGVFDQEEARHRLGQILLSAIMHGGLLSATTLAALLDALGQPASPLRVVGGRVFVELSLSHEKHEDAEFRRWFPDPLTTCLLLQTPPGLVRAALGQPFMPHEKTRQFILRCIAVFLRHTHAPFRLPRALGALLDAVRLDLESRIPIYLVNYAARTFVSHSLKPAAFLRLHGIASNTGESKAQSDTVQEKERISAEIGPPGQGIAQDALHGGEVEARWIGPLREALKGDDRAGILTRIDHLLAAPMPCFATGEVGEIFASFARRLFARTNDNKVKLAVSTARAMALSVATRLGGLVGPSIAGFGAEEWAALYEEALADVDAPSTRRKLARALREFQRFLERDRQGDPLPTQEVFAVGDGLVPVDANVLTEVEFTEIRSRFENAARVAIPGLPPGDDGDRLAKIAWLVLTLAFRCGLRRMEVLKLMLDDVRLDGARADLLVRPSAARRLKTKSSTRRLPLQALMEKAELELLREWIALRRKEEAASPFSEFLFAVPSRGFRFVAQDGLFDLLHRVMREVTGDASIRFHHLRHAFASRVYLVLAASALGREKSLSKVLPGFESTLSSAQAFREKLLGRTSLTRRDLWAVCTLLGHATPAMSVEHYIHHLDIVLAEALARQGIAPATRTVVAASGASTAQVYRHLKKGTIHDWVAHRVGKCLPESVLTPASRTQKIAQAQTPQDPDDGAAASMLQIWQQLFVVATSRQPLEEVAEKLGVTAALLQKYLDSATSLMTHTSTGKGKRSALRWMMWLPDVRRPERKERIPCPIKPARRTDEAAIERLASAFRAAYRASGENRQLLRSMVTRYVMQADDEFGGMIFRDPTRPEEALDFMRGLALLGFKRSEIEFVSFDVTTLRSAKATAWRRALDLPSSVRFRKTAPPNGRRDWACPWLGIQPLFLDQRGKLKGSPAFRFVMVMAAIAMGLRF